ncbi:MAG TPA: hypothetical protein VMV69_03250 [Pirellulales bacterium]|nr:hypothetical protein [Pirellulales bacterium]
MPKRLPERCRPDSIREFRLAARERFKDGVSMIHVGRRTAAVYVFGYTVEMTLKAAYFKVLGFVQSQTIAINHLHGAKAGAAALGVVWKGNNLHSIESWSDLLVATRASQPGWGYQDPALGKMVLETGRLVGQVWIETLRYRKNRAYPFEVNQVREAAEWFLFNSQQI